jgi:hypothetical protein
MRSPLHRLKLSLPSFYRSLPPHVTDIVQIAKMLALPDINFKPSPKDPDERL